VLRQRGVTVLTTWETPDMTGSTSTAVISTDAASGAQGGLWSSQIYSSCDNLLSVHFDDRGGVLRRILRVQKMRDSHYDPQQRELQIASDGLRLVTTAAL
jgi:KaiC/GvpD/RAD55 family RecA-like ATPase